MSSLTRRQFIASGAAAGVMMSIPGKQLLASRHSMANDSVNVGMISCGGRARGLANQFSKVDAVNITGLCDPDVSRIQGFKKKYTRAETWRDLRGLLDSDSIDAVVVATCNHWHCLAAIWAMEAGKHVYVEKPLSHSQWEGEQTVAAARRYNKVCQIGTQQRSDPMQAEIKKFLHQKKGLGEIQAVRVNRYGIRPSIGKRETPLEIDKNVAYDLWLGPAQDRPIFRKSLHYDWHWDWNTGSGEMGNWGVHVLDDVRNNVFQDKVSLPKKIFGGGGRVVLNDAGETPNIHFVYFDTGSYPVVIGLSNLPAKPGSKKAAPHPGPNSGYVVYCEGGRFEGQRGKGVAFDNSGKKIAEFKGNNGDVLHQTNFVDAVRQQDSSMLNAEVKVGNDSTGWCNLANIAFRAGGQFSFDEAKEIGLEQWSALIEDMKAHTAEHDLELDGGDIRLSSVLELDLESGRFIGESADQANPYIKREYRKGYEVPELAGKVAN
ncbi:MAG: Gfo/Idh/MocA family oxidoreductase [Planctomycetota bacterium]